MKQERQTLSSRSSEILNRGFINGFDQISEAQLVPQAAPNRHVQAYRVKVSEGDLFTKIYIDTPQVADKEYNNYLIFSHLPFVPKLRYKISPVDQEKRLLAYDFIEGGDLHQQLTLIRGTNNYPESGLIFQSFQQMNEMGKAVVPHSKMATPMERAWPTKSPIRRDFLSADEEQVFLQDYSLVHERNREAMRDYPGYYFDRNPRNLMRNNSGVMQVDFGVIEMSSPIFDAAKLLRNGTDVRLPEGTALKDAPTRPDLLDKLSILPPGEEEKYLDYVYKINFPDIRRDSSGLNRFKHLYLFATIHTHMFYLTKYGKMLHDRNGDKNKLFSRAFYHFGMAYKTLSELENRGEDMKSLKTWLDRFMTIVEN